MCFQAKELSGVEVHYGTAKECGKYTRILTLQQVLHHFCEQKFVDQVFYVLANLFFSFGFVDRSSFLNIHFNFCRLNLKPFIYGHTLKG